MSNIINDPVEIYQYPLIIKKLLLTPLIYSPEQEIVYRDAFRYTYKELEKRICRLANSLTSLDIEQGDTVAVFDYDSPRYLEAFFAIPMMGAVIQTVNWRLSAQQLVYTLNHAEAKMIIINSDFLSILEEIRPRLQSIETIVVIAGNTTPIETSLPFDATYDDMMAAAGSHFDFPDLDENTKASTFYTTSTTGNPKGVYYSHRQIVLHTLSVALAFGAYDSIGRFRSGDVYMPLTPMFHVHAWGFPYVATLLGAKQVYPGKYEPRKFLEMIVKEKVTFSHCDPSVLQMILSCPSAVEHDLSDWKVIIGGAKFPKGLAATARNMGITVNAAYGMSETCPFISVAMPKQKMLDWEEDRFLDVIIKTGLPIPLVELDVVDVDGNPLSHDGRSRGEVVFRTPWLTDGYFKAEEETAQLWRNGWLHSGDIGHIDQEGYLSITDRLRDVIKTGGEWISSLDLEDILSQHEAVLESAAISVPHEKWGERPLMLVVLKPHFNGKVCGSDLHKFMKSAAEQGRLPRYGVPDQFEIVEQIPKTSVGKLNRRLICKQYV